MKNVEDMKVKRFQEELLADLNQLRSDKEFRKIENLPDIPSVNEDEWRDYKNEYELYKQRYEDIKNASFWRLTAPLRNLSDRIHGVKNEKKRGLMVEDKDVKQSFKSRVTGEIRVAVHLHLYYEDLVEEFFAYFNNIPEKFDLYISCRKDIEKKTIYQIALKIKNINKIIIKETINRGRDIAPFYVLFRKELQGYECLLHVHTKKSLYTGGEQTTWRQWSLDGVLKDEATVVKILENLRSGLPRVGMVFGEMSPQLPLMALHWLRNSQAGRAMLARMNIKFKNHMFFYPVGSFFWVKSSAIKPIFDLKLSYNDFEEEKGQIDGTLAHALERVIACVVKSRGYSLSIYNPLENKFTLNKSYFPLKNYFSYNVEKLSGDIIRNYEIVTFDIFDTLITRLFYNPDDVFNYLSLLIDKKLGKQIEFLKIRKSAEGLAWGEKGDYCNIDDIYEKVPFVSSFSIDEAHIIKQMEIDLELKISIPRTDMLKIFNSIKESGRKIILISDMYLPSNVIANMLEHCGYVGYDELWVSCEKGKRKDKDTIWDEFFELYGDKKTIHIGDNPHSDCQTIIDRGRDAFLILSSAEQFRLSQQYDKFEKFIDGTAANSIMLGYMVNKCLYNSPFDLTNEGFSRIGSPEKIAQGLFAPLFLKFMQYLQQTSRTDSNLLFLAREGYFLEKLYVEYCKAFNIRELRHTYFLTSRRATSVPQIERYEDISDLLNTQYTGKLSNFFSERFGITLKGKDCWISALPKDKDKILEKLLNQVDELLDIADKEKDVYLKYINQILDINVDWSKIVLVDVGYAGTIQYYLMKMLEETLDGCYLISGYEIKPERLGGTYRSLYNFWTARMFDKTSLFLEAITAAPHGQVVNFYEKNGMIEANLKRETETCSKYVEVMQQAICSYIGDIANIVKEVDMRFDKELVKCIFSEIQRDGILDKEIQAFFTVNDEYCNDGEWTYNEKERKWELKRT